MGGKISTEAELGALGGSIKKGEKEKKNEKRKK